jgi:single-strand DNA-binding protein
MSYTAQGKLVHIGDTQEVGNGFTKREFVLEIQDGQYSEKPKFELIKDKCSLLDAYAEGQQITVSFNLRGREYQSKEGKTMYFTNLQAWKVEANSQAPASTSDTPSFYNSDADNDLPF